MPIVLLTPTRGRPDAFGLLRRWVASQTLAPAAWVVASDGPADGYDLSPVPLDAGGELPIRFVPTPVPALGGGPKQSLSHNVRAAVAGVRAIGADDPAHAVLVLEDDDYYAPGYVAALAPLVLAHGLAGSPRSRWYNVARRRWRVVEPGPGRGAAPYACLCQSGVRGDRVGELALAAGRDVAVDHRLWHGGPSRTPRGVLDPALAELHIGIKGLPVGTPGYSSDHHANAGEPDPGGKVARAWGLPDLYRKYGRRKAAAG